MFPIGFYGRTMGCMHGTLLYCCIQAPRVQMQQYPMVFNLVLSWVHIKYSQGVLPIPLWLIPQGIKYKPKFEHP